MDTTRKPWFWISLPILFFCFHSYPSLAALTTITANQSLSGDQTLSSEGGIFELGFFKPGNSSNYYIGMWYKKVSVRTYVWVANRDNPVSDKDAAKLTISGSNLVLLDESQKQVWSTNLISERSGSVEAVLQDDGNLILRDRSDASDPLWQSFDHPTDTFLPGAKLKLNNKTKQPQYLTSWKNKEDPATGLFSLELDPKGSTAYLILWNKTENYWTSGPWNGHIFSLVPEMRLDYIYNFSFVSNENESYFTYSMYNTSIFSRLVMDVSGQIKQLSWLENTQQWNLFWSQPRSQCEVYDFCGAFGTCTENSLPYCNCLTGYEPKSVSDWNLEDHSGGCQRKTKLQCESSNPSSGEKDRFLAISYMSLPKSAQSVGAGNAEECESTCLSYCSCTAYAYDSNGCSIWNGDLVNLKQLSSGDNSGETLYLKLAASEFPDASKGKSKRSLALILGITLTSGVILACAIFFTYVWKRKIARKQDREIIRRNQGRFYDSERDVNDLLDQGDLEEKNNEGIQVPYFDFESILVATDNFSDANKLGRGGYGPVYKGKLQGGQAIAVKRLSRVSWQGSREFKNEVVLIAKLQHRNLVRLRGYCTKGDEKILLYEYLPNRSLDSFIFDPTKRVDWQMRFDIIQGVARGLLYLHQDSRLRVIHRDLKTSNILLDEKMQPKISDFGLARIFGGKDNVRNTNRIVGTYGYVSPEYASKGHFSTKSDVFSFGVVLLEIVSGKRNRGFYQSDQVPSLLGYAWRLWTEKKLQDLMDLSLRETCNMNQFTRCVHVGLLCVQDDPNDRPSMSNVVTMLGFETLPTPKQPTYYEKKNLGSQASSINVAASLQFDSSYQEGR